MRIIAGKFKRQRLTAPFGTDITRPTSDRVKESLFNILQVLIHDEIVLDLFAGSGALGIEALSRGAQKAYFVEENKLALQCIQSNLEALKIHSQHAQVYAQNVSHFLHSKPALIKGKIGVIFADPPYACDWNEKALHEIEESLLCKAGCLVVFEVPLDKKILLAPQSTLWQQLDVRKYGKTKIEIWRFYDQSL
jgi:16S rRNA (guanine966-N2)-methyltransferase